MQIPKYTLGVGDRFGHEGAAQLSAFVAARAEGIEVSPVWNKSNREHNLIGSHPANVRIEADAAVKSLGWTAPYFVDADHISLKTVERFIPTSDYFTLDVANYIGSAPGVDVVEDLIQFIDPWMGSLAIPGMGRPLEMTPALIRSASARFLSAMQEAGSIYAHIVARKGGGNFITEISIDESDRPQTPEELFLILAMIAREKIPVETIAPKFTGHFYKGVDYVGDLDHFASEFNDYLCVIDFAIAEFGLPESLKLSVHSGSDKFSLYPTMRRLMREHGAGLHLKTAGATWLEEMIGLAEAGGDGLELAKEVYREAITHLEEVTAPYAAVVDIEQRKLPDADAVQGWSSQKFAATLRHRSDCADYNPHFRQLIHVAFKLAARLGPRYTDALVAHREIIGRNVTGNLLARHIRPLFGS